MELSHILEWSDDSDQGGGEVRDQEVEEDGLVFKVHPPIRTYDSFGRSEAGREEVVRAWGPEFKRETLSVGVRSFSDIDVGFLQGIQCGSAEGDPGELLAGSEPWEEEEVTAGPSTASWTGYRHGGKAVRAKDVVKQYATGLGFAPPSGRVSKGKRPGYASQGEGHKTALRRPRVSAAQLEELIKKARFGNQSGDTDTDERESGDSLDFDEDSVEEGEIRDEEKGNSMEKHTYCSGQSPTLLQSGRGSVKWTNHTGRIQFRSSRAASYAANRVKRLGLPSNALDVKPAEGNEKRRWTPRT
ncbi:hypothetical protein NDU88_004896 [Pleurodeles waltl]|uniref:Uncharacterized protein n=1 Tax=Pleurodeles waltl TaxID=8319 RepID=A0AAV7TSU3_PLEWA|nr:hypothetical protein NDU88_004896 [Pleurodeles waltl]